MFTIAFRCGRDEEAETGSRALYNDEYLCDKVNSVVYHGTVGESFVNLISGDITGHPYLQFDEVIKIIGDYILYFIYQILNLIIQEFFLFYHQQKFF